MNTPPPSDRTQVCANNAVGKVVPPDVRLHELIGEYWMLAYNEGKEGRTHDTAFGDAQRVARAICDTIRELAAAPTSEPPISTTTTQPGELTDQQTAVKFYQDNPSAALFDMRRRMTDRPTPAAQAVAQPTSPAPAAPGVPSEREQFEAWVRENGGDPKHWLAHRPESGYDNSRIQDNWLGWNARAASPSTPGVDAAKPLRWLTNREILPILQQAMTFEQCCDLTQKAIAQLNGLPLHGAAGDGKDGM
jgi:hypothetical protein